MPRQRTPKLRICSVTVNSRTERGGQFTLAQEVKW